MDENQAILQALMQGGGAGQLSAPMTADGQLANSDVAGGPGGGGIDAILQNIGMGQPQDREAQLAALLQQILQGSGQDAPMPPMEDPNQGGIEEGLQPGMPLPY